MRSEKDKMLGGELYDPLDPQLSAERRRTRLLLKALNDTRDDQQEARARLIRELIPESGQSVWIEPPFYCDYGSHITLGDKVFFNFNCVVLDVAPVRIGSGVLMGPAVQIYAATHPLSAAERRTGLEYGQAVEIGAPLQGTVTTAGASHPTLAGDDATSSMSWRHVNAPSSPHASGGQARTSPEPLGCCPLTK